MMSHIVLQHIYNCNLGAGVCVCVRAVCLSGGDSVVGEWGDRRGEGGVSPCSCPKMKEASQDKNSQTWKRRVEREELKSWEKEEKWEGIWTGCICPGTWDLNSAHGGLAVVPSVSFLCRFENLLTSMSHVVCKFTGLGSAGCVWL